MIYKISTVQFDKQDWPMLDTAKYERLVTNLSLTELAKRFYKPTIVHGMAIVGFVNKKKNIRYIVEPV